MSKSGHFKSHILQQPGRGEVVINSIWYTIFIKMNLFIEKGKLFTPTLVTGQRFGDMNILKKIFPKKTVWTTKELTKLYITFGNGFKYSLYHIRLHFKNIYFIW